MKNNIELEKLYIITSEIFTKIRSDKNKSEESLIKVILILNFNKKFDIFSRNNYNFNNISKLFRFYEEELKNSFKNDKERFFTLFKIYLLLIKIFTTLCKIFSVDKYKRELIAPIFQILKESKNLLKFFIPFKEKELNILNNLIGEQLYYFTHILYVHTKNKTLDYIFEEYFLYCESMQHGFELSKTSNFGDKPKKNYETEKMIFINHLSFLLLKMIYKLAYYKNKPEYFNNGYFLNIKEFFINESILNKNSTINTKKEFEKALIQEFKNSANFLKNKKNYDMRAEKIRLLELNTDEYKQLIDIISSSK